MPLARHVFISFASADGETAHRIVGRLEQSGVRCWIADRDIDPAGSYPSAITAAIADSGVVLLLLTAAANKSPHVHREVELAFNARRPVLPVRIAGAVPTDDLQYFLSRSQWFDAGAAVDDAEISRLYARLRELLASPAGRAEPRPWWRRPPVIAIPATAAVAMLVLAFWNGRLDPRAEPEALSGAGSPAASAPSARIHARDGQEYVWVPPGTFTMGCSDTGCDEDERPAHVVAFDRGFWMGRTEVTVLAYAGATAANTAGAGNPLPAVAVSWADAGSYCGTIGGRLPSEAEWEYAARAGTTGPQYGPLADTAWFVENSDEAPHPVGTKAPNAFGLHDMLGNVSEWVRDRYYNRYDPANGPGEIEEPRAGNALAVARGGSWLTEASEVRVSRRLAMEPDAQAPHIGFRCVLDEL